MNKTRMVLPNDCEKVLSFNNYRFKEAVPFVIYVDLESILEPLTNRIQKHVPHSVAFYLKCVYDDQLSYFKFNSGPDCIEWFMEELLKVAQDVNDKLNNIVPMIPVTAIEKRQFNDATVCHICKKSITLFSVKHRDHRSLSFHW